MPTYIPGTAGVNDSSVFSISSYSVNRTENGTRVAYGLVAWGDRAGYIRLHRVQTTSIYNVTFSPTLLYEHKLGSALHGVALVGNGTLLVTGGADGVVRVWSVAENGTLELRREMEDGRADAVAGVSDTGIFAVAASDDASVVVAGSYTGDVYAWNATGLMWKIEGTHAILNVALSPDRSFCVVVGDGSGDSLSRVLSMASGSEISNFTGHGRWVYGVSISPDSKLVATSSAPGTTKPLVTAVWRAADGIAVHSINKEANQEGVYAVAFSPDGSYFVTAGNDFTLRFYSTATGAKTRPDYDFPSSKTFRTITAAPDGTFLALGTLPPLGGAGGVVVVPLIQPVPLPDPMLRVNSTKSFLSCSSQEKANGGHAMLGATVSCTFHPRNGYGDPVAVDGAEFSVAPGDAANASAAAVVALGDGFASGNASALLFTARMGATGPAELAVLRTLVNATAAPDANGTRPTFSERYAARALTVLPYPDATSTVACTPASVFVDTVATCRVTLRRAGSPAPALLGVVGVGSVTGSAANATLNFTAGRHEASASGPASSFLVTVGAMGVEGIVPSSASFAVPIDGFSPAGAPLVIATISANITVAPSYLPPVPVFGGMFASKLYMPVDDLVVVALDSKGSRWRDPATGEWALRDVLHCAWTLVAAPGNTRKVNLLSVAAGGENNATFTWKTPAIGNYSLTMVATDNAGFRGSLTRAFTIFPPKNWQVAVKLDIGYEEFRAFYPNPYAPDFLAKLAAAAGLEAKQLYDVKHYASTRRRAALAATTVVAFKSFRMPKQDPAAYRSLMQSLAMLPFGRQFGVSPLSISKDEFEMTEEESFDPPEITLAENVRFVRGRNGSRVQASASLDVPLIDLYWSQVSGPVSVAARFAPSVEPLDPFDAGFDFPADAPFGQYVLTLTAVSALNDEVSKTCVVEVVNATSSEGVDYTTSRAIGSAMSGAIGAVAGITAVTAAAQVVSGAQAAMSGGGGGVQTNDGGGGGGDGGGGDGGGADAGGGADVAVEADHRVRRTASTAMGMAGVGIAAAGIAAVGAAAAVGSAVGGGKGAPAQRGRGAPAPRAAELRARSASPSATPAGARDAGVLHGRSRALAAGDEEARPRAGQAQAEATTLPGEVKVSIDSSEKALLPAPKSREELEREARLAKKRAQSETFWDRIGKVLAGVMGIFGHLSFLASTAYVGGGAAPPGYKDMADSLSWALLKPTMGPWGRSAGTGTTTKTVAVTVPVDPDAAPPPTAVVAGARALLGERWLLQAVNTTTKTVTVTEVAYTSADKWWDDFTSVLFWSAVVLAFVLFLRALVVFLCRVALRAKTGGVVPTGIRWPLIDLMVMILMLPGICLFTGFVVSTQGGWRRGLGCLILLCPITFMLWITYMAWTRIHRRRTIVFIRHRRRKDVLAAQAAAAAAAGQTSFRRGSLFDTEEQRRAFASAKHGAVVEGEIVEDVTDASTDEEGAGAEGDDARSSGGFSRYSFRNDEWDDGDPTRERDPFAKKPDPLYIDVVRAPPELQKKQKKRGCWRGFIRAWKRMQRAASKGRWRATDEDEEEFMERYSPVFEEYCFRRLAFLGGAMDAAKKAATCLTIGFWGADQSNAAMYVALMLLFCYSALHLIFLVVIRPYRDRIENIVQSICTAAEATIFVLMWILLGRGSAANDGISGALLAINIGVTLLLTLNQMRQMVGLFELFGEGAKAVAKKPVARRRARIAARHAEEDRLEREAAERAPKEAAMGDPWHRLYHNNSGEVVYKPEIRRVVRNRSIEADLRGLPAGSIAVRPDRDHHALVEAEPADVAVAYAAVEPGPATPRPPMQINL